MNFISRTSLGKKMSNELLSLRGKDAVIICLNEVSLMTCLQMAKTLRAWVYPLILVPIYGQDSSTRIGAISLDGTFCVDPDGPLAGLRPLPVEADIAVKAQKSVTKKILLAERAKYDMSLESVGLQGRDIVIAASALSERLPVAVAVSLLQGVQPKSITTVIGNASESVTDLVGILSDKSYILDVMSGITSNENSYFEKPDPINIDQQRILVKHIAAYWQ